MTSRERARPLSPEQRRAAIIDAVMPLIGPDSAPITTRQIAEAAGIAEGTIFRVFPDKKSMFIAIAEAVTQPLATDLRHALESVTELEDKIEIVVSMMLDRTEKLLVVMNSLRLAMAGEVFHAKPGPGAPQFLIDANRQIRTELIETLFAPHRAQIKVTPETAATLLQGLVFGLAHPSLVPPSRFDPRVVSTMFLDGVRA